MDAKRKVHAASGGGDSVPAPQPAPAKERSTKRRKVSAHTVITDVKQAGRSFLAAIRAVKDKTNRPITRIFERLPPKNSDAWEKYWEITKRPLSLLMIQERLESGTIKSLSELEGYYKRMVNNAKEAHPKGSDVWEDAERMRKAGGNYMRSHNPDYAHGNYTATAVPEDQDPNDPDPKGEYATDDDDVNGTVAAGSDDAGSDADEDGSPTASPKPAEADGTTDEAPKPTRNEASPIKLVAKSSKTESKPTKASPAKPPAVKPELSRRGNRILKRTVVDDEQQQQQDQTATSRNSDEMDVDDEEEDTSKEEDGEEEGGEGDEDGEEEEEEEEEEDEEEDEEEGDEEAPVVKKRGPGRPPKDPEAHARKKAAKAARDAARAAPVDKYKNKPYKGLSFQQAQEKVVEELLRAEDDNGDQYFMDFVEPPPRSLKTYYRIIERPMALKKLQNMVRGITGRAFTGTSEFKSWDDFEATASLLWKNAFQFNEDDSDIFLIAKDLETACKEEMAQARKCCPEPTALKIKLKVPTSESTTPAAGGSKKITLHSTRRASTLAAKDEEESASRDGSTPVPRLQVGSTRASRAGSRSPSAQPAQPAAAEKTPTPAPAQPDAPLMPPGLPIPRSNVRDRMNRRPARMGIECSPIVNVEVTTSSLPTHDAGADDWAPLTQNFGPDPTLMQIGYATYLPANHRRLRVKMQFKKLDGRAYTAYFIHNDLVTLPISRSDDGFLCEYELELSPGGNKFEFQIPVRIPKEELSEEDGFTEEVERLWVFLDVPVVA